MVPTRSVASENWGPLAFTALLGILVTTSTLWWLRGIAEPAPLTAATKALSPLATASLAPAPSVLPPEAQTLHSSWVSQDPYPFLYTGDRVTVSIVFRNAGTATWVKGTAAEARLGVTNAFDPSMALDWPYPARAAVQEEARVTPGEVATFNVGIIGTTPGRFRLQLRPVVDGVAWMEDQGVYIDVEVHESPR